MVAVLLNPTMNNADALTEDECLTLAGHKYSDGTLRYEAYYEVLTCETNGFDVTVYPGQRLMIQDPNGGGAWQYALDEHCRTWRYWCNWNLSI